MKALTGKHFFAKGVKFTLCVHRVLHLGLIPETMY